MTNKAPKKCVQCGNTFEPRKTDQKYCQRKCSLNNANDKLKEVYKIIRAQDQGPCARCGGPCPPDRLRKYCSVRCRIDANIESTRMGSANNKRICELCDPALKTPTHSMKSRYCLPCQDMVRKGLNLQGNFQ